MAMLNICHTTWKIIFIKNVDLQLYRGYIILFSNELSLQSNKLNGHFFFIKFKFKIVLSFNNTVCDNYTINM